MKMANIGVGVGAFTDGLLSGLQLGRTLKTVRNENEIEEIRRSGMADAEMRRNAKIDSRIKTLPAQDGLGDIKFQVGDQTFSSREEARKAAGRDVESAMDIFMRNAVPKIQQAYLAQGNIEKAESWGKWVKTRTGNSAIKQWATGYFAAQRGDWDKAATAFGKYYTDYIDDDMQYVGHETLKDGNGNVTGFSVKLKDRKSGKETTLPLGTEEMLQMGMSHNPQALFDGVWQQQLAADKARLDDAKAERQYEREQHGRIELEGVKAQLKDRVDQRKFDRKVNALRQSGYSEEFIQRVLPSLLGVDSSGPYRKGPSPEERVAMLFQERIKDRRFQKMTEEERRAELRRNLQTIQEAAEIVRGVSQPDPLSPAGQAATNGVIYDTRTGQFIPVR